MTMVVKQKELPFEPGIFSLTKSLQQGTVDVTCPVLKALSGLKCPLGVPRGRGRALNPACLTQLLMLFPQCSMPLLFLQDLGMVSDKYEKSERLHKKSFCCFPFVFLGGRLGPDNGWRSCFTLRCQRR